MKPLNNIATFRSIVIPFHVMLVRTILVQNLCKWSIHIGVRTRIGSTSRWKMECGAYQNMMNYIGLRVGKGPMVSLHEGLALKRSVTFRQVRGNFLCPYTERGLQLNKKATNQ